MNCFKATQVLGGLTQILIWGSEIAKGPIDKLRGDLELWYQLGGPKFGGGPKIGGGAYEPQWCHELAQVMISPPILSTCATDGSLSNTLWGVFPKVTKESYVYWLIFTKTEKLILVILSLAALVVSAVFGWQYM